MRERSEKQAPKTFQLRYRHAERMLRWQSANRGLYCPSKSFSNLRQAIPPFAFSSLSSRIPNFRGLTNVLRSSNFVYCHFQLFRICQGCYGQFTDRYQFVLCPTRGLGYLSGFSAFGCSNTLIKGLVLKTIHIERTH